MGRNTIFEKAKFTLLESTPFVNLVLNALMITFCHGVSEWTTANERDLRRIHVNLFDLISLLYAVPKALYPVLWKWEEDPLTPNMKC